MKDLMLLRYQLNENYHDSKEGKGWLAIALFYSFSIGLLSFVYKTRISITNLVLIMMIFLILTIFSIIFISNQFNKKAETVLLKKYYDKIFYTKDITITINDLETINKYFSQIDVYVFEMPLIIIMYILYSITQIYMIKRVGQYYLPILLYGLFTYFLSLILLISITILFLHIDKKAVKQYFINTYNLTVPNILI